MNGTVDQSYQYHLKPLVALLGGLLFFFVPSFVYAGSASITATPNSSPLYTGGTVTITWSSSDTVFCDGTGFSTGGAKSGTVTVTPTTSGVKTYSVSCFDATPACTLQLQNSWTDDGGPGNTCNSNISYYSNSCYPKGATCTTKSGKYPSYSFSRYQCLGSCSTVTKSASVTVSDPPPPPDPSVTLTASPTTVTAGSSALLSWSSTRATSCKGTGFSTGGNTSGSVTVTPTANTTYSITCDSEVYSSAPGTWQYVYTDYTDLWCSSTPSYTNYYTNHECSTSNPAGTSCVGSSECFVNTWQTKGSVIDGQQYCTLKTDAYRCNGGSAPNQITDSVSVIYNQKPNAPTITGATTGIAGVSYSFSFKASDPDSNTVRYRIDWNNDATVDQNLPSSGYVNSNTSQSTTYSWTTSGTYQIQARTQDSPGAQSSWTSHTIVIGNPAVGGSCTASPALASTGDSVTWAATPSGGNGFYTYSWSGTDGLAGTAQSVAKTYLSAGTKTASVTITSGGQSSAVSCSNSVSVQSQCSDGNDNDFDGLTDLTDPGCTSGVDTTESPNPALPQCNDGLDNNGINGTDYPADPACSSASDNDEGIPPPANLSLSVARWLVLKGSSAVLTWSAIDVKSGSCTLSGTNGDAWSGESGSSISSPLSTQTVFTLSCIDYNEQAVSDSKTIRLIPWYGEF